MMDLGCIFRAGQQFYSLGLKIAKLKFSAPWRVGASCKLTRLTFALSVDFHPVPFSPRRNVPSAKITFLTKFTPPQSTAFEFGHQSFDRGRDKGLFAPPSEPDWPISGIRLSSWWLTFKKIGMPQCTLVLR